MALCFFSLGCVSVHTAVAFWPSNAAGCTPQSQSSGWHCPHACTEYRDPSATICSFSSPFFSTGAELFHVPSSATSPVPAEIDPFEGVDVDAAGVVCAGTGVPPLFV